MKIQIFIFIIFSVVIITTVSLISISTFGYTESLVIESNIDKMKFDLLVKKSELEILHQRASEDLVYTLQNPLFVEYFELPETKAGNVYDENNVIQFTDEQKRIKGQLEKWIYHFQNKFDVDETCIIDLSGQEHGRLVLSKIAPDDDLSKEEASAPFFESSFQKNKGEVHIQEPYISPDTSRWVFAYTSPVVLGDEQKPAFYHFEMPISVFADKLETDRGQIFIMDKEGRKLLDPNNPSLYKETSYRQNFDGSTDTIYQNDIFVKDFDINQLSLEENYSTFVNDGQKFYVVYEEIEPFGWYIVHQLPHSEIDIGEISIVSIRNVLLLLTGGVMFVGLIGSLFVSNRISKPIKILSDASKKISNGDYNGHVKVKGSAEILELSESFNKMTGSINNHFKRQKVDEKLIKLQLEKLEKAEKLKDEFSSMISHELKTPLTPILGYCEMLLDPDEVKNLTEEQKSFIASINGNAARLEVLIGDVLDAQKIALGKMKYNKTQFNVVEFMNTIVEDSKPLMKEKQIQLVAPPIKEIMIYSDEDRIREVLDNLIRNAVDFVPDKKGSIEVGVSPENDSLLFYVKDNGIGIALEKQKLLFKKFYQIDTDVTRKHGGTGLGLVICKGLVEGLGGKIWVESKEGKGTTFYFSIPKK